jgi:hypothetical protein
MLILIVVASVAILFWKSKLPSADDISGSIVIHKADMVQTDTWLYERGTGVGLRRIPWNGFTHPVFDSPDRLDELKMSMEINGEDRFAFVYQSLPAKTVAFMHRKIEPVGGLKNVQSSHDSPMHDLAKNLYLTKGATISGETIRAGEIWPAVMIEAAPR